MLISSPSTNRLSNKNPRLSCIEERRRKLGEKGKRGS
jgi:hypothetical protein